jgi:endo-1,4-beta-xylanase
MTSVLGEKNRARFAPQTATAFLLISLWSPGLASLAAPAAEKPATLEALSGGRVEERIQEHRTARATLIISDADGRPLANRTVVLEQTKHQFLFGCNAFRINPDDQSQLQADYQRRFADLLNFATLGFYWGSYEPARGQPQAERLRGMAAWCRDQGLLIKGHPLVWHQVTPRWTGKLPLEEVHQLQIDRVAREVNAFAGLIDIWDVVNEAVVMPDFKQDTNQVTALADKLGRLPLIQQSFDAARQANPKATLILNDFDTSERFEQLIEACLDAGIKIDVIGIQSHMHTGYRGAAWAWETCERFARFGKPLHFTETTIISGRIRADVRWHGPRHDDWPTTTEGEQLQARQVDEFYQVLFSHPAVQAITWWDFSDHAWLGAPAGLVRKDMSPKPAYERLMSRIKGDWWTGRRTLSTDDQGRLTFRGFLGEYQVQSEGAGAAFSLDKPGETSAKLTLRKPTPPKAPSATR